MSPFRDRDFQADSYYNNNEGKIDQPTQNSSPIPKTLDAFKDTVVLEPQPNKELNKSEDDSGETDSELNLYEFSCWETADVDICDKELKRMETVEEQMLESVQEPDSAHEENETAEKELDPITLSSYRGLADVDVCAEELQSTLLEEEHTEGSRDLTVTDAGLIPPSESPDSVLVKQDVLDTHNELIPSGMETLLYVDQDADKELNDISYSEQTVGSLVKEDEIGETGHFSEVGREITNTLFDDAGIEIHNLEPLHLHEQVESVNVSDEAKTFDKTNTDEIPLGVEIQQADDILAAEAMSESSFSLEKASLADWSNEYRPGMEDLVNVASEVQEEVNDQESVIAATDERDSLTDMKEDETNDEKQTDPKDIFETVPVECMEGLVDSNYNPTGFSAEDVIKDDTTTSQQDVDEVEDTSKTEKGNNSMNAPETQEDNLFYSAFTHESKGTLPVPTSEESDQGMEITSKQSAVDSQEHTKEPETATDYEVSQHEEGMIHEPLFESENKELDQQVRCRYSALFESRTLLLVN